MMHMKTYLSILSLVLLTGCATVPKIDPQKQCTISFADRLCRCRMYEISEERVGGIPGTIKHHPIEHCEGITGYPRDNYVNITTWIISVFKWANRNQEVQYYRTVDPEFSMQKFEFDFESIEVEIEPFSEGNI